jgi:hypothetical protein
MTREEEVRLILDEHADRLAGLPNVVGLGIIQADTVPDECRLAVYVRSKIPEVQLKPVDIIPPTLTSMIAGNQVDVQTQVIEVGNITH